MNIGAEDRLTRLKAERGKDGFRRDAAIAGQMNLRDAEARVVDKRGNTRIHPVYCAADIAADEQCGEKCRRDEKRSQSEHRAAERDPRFCGAKRARKDVVRGLFALAERLLRRRRCTGLRWALRPAFAVRPRRGMRSIFTDRMTHPPPSSGKASDSSCRHRQLVPAPERSASCPAGCWFPAARGDALPACRHSGSRCAIRRGSQGPRARVRRDAWSRPPPTRDFGRQHMRGTAGRIFGFVVIEFEIGRDLRHTERLAAHHGDGEFTARDKFLDHHLVAESPFVTAQFLRRTIVTLADDEDATDEPSFTGFTT